MLSPPTAQSIGNPDPSPQSHRPGWYTVVLPFGRWRGHTLAQIIDADPHYLIWLADESDSQTWRDLARKALGLLDDGDEEEPSLTPRDGDTPARIAVPRFIWEVIQALRAEYAGDPIALAIIDRVFLHLKWGCTDLTGKDWLPEGTDPS